MEEKDLTTNPTQEDNVDYIQAINDLKNSTVPKEQYTKLKEENSKLLKSIISGDTSGIETKEKTDATALRKDLFNVDNPLSNLDYITKVLELRDTIIEEGGNDPFLPYGSKIAPDNNDIECANRVAEVLKDCVDYAQGDSLVFTNELQRRMIDTAPKKVGKR